MASLPIHQTSPAIPTRSTSKPLTVSASSS
jgi:hypothetical protein